MIKYAQLVSSIALILFSATTFYVAHGAFNRFDRVEEISKRVEFITVSMSELLDEMQQKFPEISNKTVKGFIDGVRDGLGEKRITTEGVNGETTGTGSE